MLLQNYCHLLNLFVLRNWFNSIILSMFQYFFDLSNFNCLTFMIIIIVLLVANNWWTTFYWLKTFPCFVKFVFFGAFCFFIKKHTFSESILSLCCKMWFVKSRFFNKLSVSTMTTISINFRRINVISIAFSWGEQKLRKTII